MRDALYGHLAFGLRKDSELRDIFNYYLLKMEQSGFMDALHQKWLENPYTSNARISSGSEDAFALGYDNVMFPFLGLSFGLVASVVMSLLEWTRRRSTGTSFAVSTEVTQEM